MNLKNYINNNINQNLILKLNIKNWNNLPKINKIILNIGISNLIKNKNKLLESLLMIELITNQKPILIKAKKSISVFNIRKGIYNSCKITLRNENMFLFLFKLNKIIFPKLLEFKGFSYNSFNKYGNYSFFFSDLFSFPEIEFKNDLFNEIIGINISIISSLTKINANYLLFSSLQIPFQLKKKKNEKIK